jgi:hypothetical protein
VINLVKRDLIRRSFLKVEAQRFSDNFSRLPILWEPSEVSQRLVIHWLEFETQLAMSHTALGAALKTVGMTPLSARSISMDSTFKCNTANIIIFKKYLFHYRFVSKKFNSVQTEFCDQVLWDTVCNNVGNAAQLLSLSKYQPCWISVFLGHSKRANPFQLDSSEARQVEKSGKFEFY